MTGHRLPVQEPDHISAKAAGQMKDHTTPHVVIVGGCAIGSPQPNPRKAARLDVLRVISNE